MMTSSRRTRMISEKTIMQLMMGSNIKETVMDFLFICFSYDDDY